MQTPRVLLRILPCAFMMRGLSPARLCLVLLLGIAVAATSAGAYSVLTHEEIVDLLWNEQIQPLLLKRFPSATPEDLRRAHAYAYGGCVIQDMGYYPFGSQDFSELVHYVRSGDFVTALLDDATDLNEYAFALGALSHYASDITGHPTINHAVAVSYPKLRARYGESVTYAEDPKAHIRTEFGFDVAQIAKRRYAPDAYHDFIGFEVSKELLQRAFRRTYGIEITQIFSDFDLAVGTYRRSVSKIIPEMTRAALLTHRVQLEREIPNFNKKKFVYNLSRADYRKQWGNSYRRPGVGARIIAFIFHLLPKVGPLKAVAFQTPTAQTEDMYFKSVNDTVENYRGYLQQLRAGRLQLANRDFDTGKNTVLGEYALTDRTYEILVHRLAESHFDGLTPELREEVLAFFGDNKPKITSKKEDERWQRTRRELEALRATKPSANAAVVPQPR